MAICVSFLPFYIYAVFLPHDAMRKCGLCCPPVSVRPSVSLTVTFVHRIRPSVCHVRILYPDG